MPGGSTGITVRDAKNQITTYVYDASNQIHTIQPPSGKYTVTVNYNGSQVSSVSNGTGTWTYNYSVNGSQSQVTVTDPLGHARYVLTNVTTNLVTFDQDALGRDLFYTYDSFGRVTGTTYPEGNQVQNTYDSQVAGTTRGNIVTVTNVAKPGSALSSTTTNYSYDTTCSFPVKCNKPNSITDSNNNTTNYTWDNAYGVLAVATPPPPTTGATQPQVRYHYDSLYAYYKNSSGTIVQAPSPIRLLTSTSACQTLATCSGALDEVKTTITYGTTGVANNLLPTSVSSGAGNGSLTAASSATYDAFGNLASIVGPLGSGQTTLFVYDANRERVGVFGPQTSVANGYPAVRLSWSVDGILTETETGKDTSQTDSNFTTFTSLQQVTNTPDSLNRTIKTTVSGLVSGSTVTFNVTQFDYDAANRVTCQAQRMNPAVFSSLPGSACALGTVGSNGNDRIAFNTYDAADELTQVTTGYGTGTQRTYLTRTFTNNGLLKSILDADNNLTTYAYDGFDRLAQVSFPMPTQGVGTSSATDYESYGYDSNSNLTSVRRRSNDTICFLYDALNRATQKTVPSWSGQNVFYAYDLLNRLTTAAYGSLTGPGVSYGYDALSRRTTEAASSRTITSAYDAASNRTRITWPDSFYVTYLYDNLNRPTQVGENGATSGVGVLANYSYDALGNLSGLTRGGGAGTTPAFDTDDRLTSLAHAFANSSANVTWTYGYNAGNQIVSRSATNEAYTSHAPNQSKSYVANGLNQYSSVSGASFSHDARGNLTSDGTRTFTYDVENRLLTATAPTAVTLAYDPLGRLQTSTASSATTTFLFDGAGMTAEYNSVGSLLRRYVPDGLGGVLPLIWYEGSGTSDRRWLHADSLGSSVAYSNSSGSEAAQYGYDAYGAPDATNGWGNPRYRFAGALMIPEGNLYLMGARAYDPSLGRFLQTDPVGQAADVNLYAYAGQDPVIRADPTGLANATPDTSKPIDAGTYPDPVTEWTDPAGVEHNCCEVLQAGFTLTYSTSPTTSLGPFLGTGALPTIGGGGDRGGTRVAPITVAAQKPAQAAPPSNTPPPNSTPTCTANRARHDQEVARVAQEYLVAGKMVTPNVTFTNPRTGASAVADLVISNFTFPLPDPYLIIEVKTGMGQLERGQPDVYGVIAGSGGTLVPRGLNALRAGFIPGVPVDAGPLRFSLRRGPGADGC